MGWQPMSGDADQSARLKSAAQRLRLLRLALRGETSRPKRERIVADILRAERERSELTEAQNDT